MPNKYLRGYSQKQVYKNERFTKGTVSTNDPLFEGSFRRIMNFKISNQNASIENRDPFLTVPFYNLRNEEVTISKNSIVFSFNSDTENAYILDLNQKEIFHERFNATYLHKGISLIDDGYVIDGDTISYRGNRYRLAFVDTPELEDFTYSPIDDTKEFKTMGEESKEFTKEFLDRTLFDIVQFDFQTEKIDEYGRPLVFIITQGGANVERRLLNSELLRNGLAFFYGTNNILSLTKTFKIHNNCFLDDEEQLRLKNIFSSAYNEGKNVINSCFSNIYTDLELNIEEEKSDSTFTKVLVHKIKKETDLKKIQIEEVINEQKIFKEKIIKRIIETFEINELRVKSDLEIFNDTNLIYKFISKEFSLVNTKYGDQSLNFYVQAHNTEGIEVYRGLMELTKSASNSSNGTRETFYFRSYQKPENHIEIQDVTNYKPNILSDRSMIPETYIGKKSNAKGYTSPSVNAVLLNIDLNENLEKIISNDDSIVTKFFSTNRAIFDDIDRYKLTPFFKAPILNSEKNRYMYRWDFVNLKEIDYNNPEEVKNFKPFYRTAWTELTESINLKNLSENDERKKVISTRLDNIKSASEFYFIRALVSRTNPKNITETELLDVETLKDNDDKDLKYYQEKIDSFIENNNYDSIKKTLIGTQDNYIVIEGVQFEIIKPNDFSQIIKTLEVLKEDDNFNYSEDYIKQSKTLSLEDRKKIFDEENQDKKISFIFTPISVIVPNGDKVRGNAFYSWKTKGLFYSISEDRKVSVPYNINFNELKNMEEMKDFDFNDFFKNGIQATFYLYNFKDEKSILETDEFYDNIAYKKTTPTYLFRNTNNIKYSSEDFIDDKLDGESYAIKYCKYITEYQDRIITYGNSNYKNTVFMSEEGAPYYFTLLNTFDFDHQVVHVQTFKTIALVFTINDIWVIYPIEEKNQETFEVTIHYRIKKVLYNISTEEKNKNSIKNITRYITLLSNNVLYLIKPSTYINDDTQFYLNILSTNVDSIVKNPLEYINERLIYHGIQETASSYKMNLNATDNYIKVYYSSVIKQKRYTLILTYDIIASRWSEEDTISFGYPEQIYLLDSTTKYEMLTNINDNVFITYQTDKYKNYMLDEYLECYYDLYPSSNQMIGYEKEPIRYYIDTGYLKLNEHLRKRFKLLQITLKNIDSKKILFTYNFQIDDLQFENNLVPEIRVNSSNEYIQVNTFKEKEISNISFMDNFLLDFSNLQAGDIATLNNNLLGKGRLPRIKMGFSTKNRFYLLSFGIIYTEGGGQ